MPSNRQENTSKDARLVNGFMEREIQGDTWLYKRPGFVRSRQPSGMSGLGQGCYNWGGDVYSIFNGTLYKNAENKGGTINTTNGVYRFSSIMGATPRLVFANGIRAFSYDDTNLLQDFTGNLAFKTSFHKGLVYLDGTLYIMSPGPVIGNSKTGAFANIWGSEINNILTWAADNVLIAQIEPDRGVALAKQLVYVIVFKDTSTEVFFDAGNATGSPLGRVEGAKINWGCANQDSVREMDGSLFWLSTNRSASIQVMKMDNLRVDIISTPAIERLLSGVDTSQIRSWTLKYEGHKWYAYTLVNANITLVYDLTTGLWAQWTDSAGNCLPFVDSTYDSTTNQTLLQHGTDGYLYVVDGNTFVDADGPITVDIYTPNYDAGTARDKNLSKMYFDTNQASGSFLQVRHSDDDYQTWSGFRQVDLGQRKPSLENCGTFKRRAYNFRHTSNTRFRVKAVDLQMEIGSL